MVELQRKLLCICGETFDAVNSPIAIHFVQNPHHQVLVTFSDGQVSWQYMFKVKSVEFPTVEFEAIRRHGYSHI